MRYHEWLRITPQCCRPARVFRAVYLSVDDDVPKWRLSTPYENYAPQTSASPPTRRSNEREPSPTHCPYCGSALPAIEPRVGVRSPVHVPTKPCGDYCRTCDERATYCSCVPPWGVWQPAGGDDLDVDALRRQWSLDMRQFR